MRFTLITLENRQQRLAHQRVNLAIADLFGVFRTGHIDERAHEIYEMPWLPRDTAGFGLQSLRPMHNEWRTNTAFVLVLFVEPKRRVARVRPTGIISPVRLGIPRLKVATARALKGTSAVVRAEKK